MTRFDRNFLLAISLSLLVVFSLGQRSEAQQRSLRPRDIRMLQNVPYATGADADPKFHVSDLYLPEGKSNFPMLFFIHGGGWRAGDKVYAGLDHIVNICNDLGMGVISVNYRVGPNLNYKIEMQDLARAFAWWHENASKYGADPNTTFVAGGSAGAHLAALLGADPEYLAAYNLSPKMIKGVMLFSGVYDMGNWFTLGNAPGNVASETAGKANSAVGNLYPMVKEHFGTDYEELRKAGADAYIGTMGKDTPPYLIAYTDDDMYGMAEQATTFYSLFLRHGLPAELVEMPGRIHETKTSGIDSKVDGADDVLGPAIERFMTSVLNGTFGDTVSAVWPAKGAEAPKLKVVRDLRYDNSPGSDPKLNALDLYLPEGKDNIPLVFYIHGGGWRAGDKGEPETLVTLFARMGVGLAAVNYRLAPQVKHPAQVEDVARAFAWIYKNADQYKIDRNRIVVVGASAGGHLASLLALDTQYLEKQGVPTDAVKGVASLSGIYDLASWPEPGKIPTRKEQAFGIDPAVLRQASPSTYVSAKAPPFLITFTNWDLFMIREQALEMYNIMLNKHAPVELVMVPGRTHVGLDGIGRNLNQVDDVLGPALARFVAARVKVPNLQSMAVR